MRPRASDSARSEPPTSGPGRRERLGRGLQRLLIAGSVVIALNALVGERGLLEMRRTGRARHELAASIEKLRQENAALAEEARRLRQDPAAIEQIARRELGLLRRGEVVVVLRPPRVRPPA